MSATIAAKYLASPRNTWDGTEKIPLDVGGSDGVGLASTLKSYMWAGSQIINPGSLAITDAANPSASTLSLTGATALTTSQPLINGTQTWNAGVVTFTGLKLNITSTASAAGSLLMDLQVGGSSKFNVDKTGITTGLRFTLATNGNYIGDASDLGGSNAIWFKSNGILGLGLTGTTLILNSAVSIGWASLTIDQAADLKLTRAAAASLQLGAADAAAPVAQTLGVQSVVAGTSNTAGANWTFAGSKSTGNAASGLIDFQLPFPGGSGTAQNALTSVLKLSIAASQAITVTIPSLASLVWSGSTTLSVSSNGALVISNSSLANTVTLFAAAAATLHLGAADVASPVAQTLGVQGVVAGTSNTAGANFTIAGSQGTGTGAGGSLIFQVAPAGTTGTAQNALAAALTIDSTSLAAFAGIVSAATSFKVPATNGVNVYHSGLSGNRDALLGALGGGVLGISSSGVIGLGSGDAASPDVLLNRDAANTIALRNGTNAQKLSVYNTFTDASNYERGIFDWAGSSNVLSIGTENAGTGSARNIRFLVGGTSKLDYGVTLSGQWFSPASINVAYQAGAGAYQLYDIGGTGRVMLGWVSSTQVQVGPQGGSATSLGIFGGSGTGVYVNSAGLFQINGQTSSFPAIKRNAAAINFRLADDSADAAITAGNLTASGDWSVSGTGKFIQFTNSGGVFWATRSTLLSSADGSITLANNAQTGFTSLLFGGTTASFPALKRSSAIIQARLADDSGPAAFQSNLVTVSKTGNYTVLTSDAATIFDNTGAAGEVDFTLPTAAAGLCFGFAVNAAQTLKVIAGASTTIAVGSTISAAAGNAASSAVGSVLWLYAVSATRWIAISNTGSWTVT